MAYVNTDPTYTPTAEHGAFDTLALRFINDPRDLPFVRLLLLQSALVLPVAAYLFAPGRFNWWLAVFYLSGTLGIFLAPFILMLHNTSHRTLFKREYDYLNQYIPFVLGPFFGESPDTYYAHHVGMHHPENNLREDLSSTMEFQRDSFIDFMRYFLRFFTAVIVELNLYFYRKKRYPLMRRALTGEILWYLVTGALMYLNWRATLVVFVFPLCLTRFLMMAGNWGQHAFIDAAAPENCYRNSVTCINCGYNRRCYNDGYHIGHHLKATRHWTEMPVEFSENEQLYIDEKAIVFEGIDFFVIWAFLMLKRYDWLARRVVDLEGQKTGQKRSLAEVEAFLRERTRRIPSALDAPTASPASA